jgi:hypothetical protein
LEPEEMMNERHSTYQNAAVLEQLRPGSVLLELVSSRAVIALLLVASLVAFELFNFDTTRYALRDLLGEVSFAGLRWATILAIAFCAIDFAGLVRFFTPDGQDHGTPNEVWYLMGAWMLGASMNALMTWWAVSLTLLNHDLGNEVIGRDQLLQFVPIFVAALVWLTRVLFIGALSVAGGQLFGQKRDTATQPLPTARQAVRPVDRSPIGLRVRDPETAAHQPDLPLTVPGSGSSIVRHSRRPMPAVSANQRVKQRPPISRGLVREPMPMRAQGRAHR